MAPLFTHDFEVRLKGDGSWFLRGEVEFNEDGEVSFNVEDSSNPLSSEGVHHFIDIMDQLRAIFQCCGGIKKIEIVQKPLPTP